MAFLPDRRRAGRILHQCGGSMSALVNDGFRWPGSRSLAAMSLALLAWFVIVVSIFHWLRPELGPTQHRISEYALGPFGALMASAFAAAAVATQLLLVGLLRDGPMTWLGRGAKYLLMFAALGLALAACFPLAAPGDTTSIVGFIHDAGLFMYVSTSLAAAFLFTLSFTLDDRWQPAVGFSLLLAVMLAVEVVLLMRGVVTQEPWGIVNRMYALTSVIWTSAVALRLIAVARS